MVRIPADYFFPATLRRPLAAAASLAAIVLLATKNLCGVLVLAGVAMLVLPGQGILTIVVGLMLLDFPGKFALERRLVGGRRYRGNELDSAKANRPPLELPPRTHPTLLTPGDHEIGLSPSSEFGQA